MPKQPNIYNLYTFGGLKSDKYYGDCDGEWFVWLRRTKINGGDGTFNLTYAEFEKGIYYHSDNFFTGLKYLSLYITEYAPIQLQIDLEYKGNRYTDLYENFSIASAADGYRMNYDSVSGNIPEDSLDHHRNRRFTTKDKDQDDLINVNCAIAHGSGWWYGACDDVQPTGQFTNADGNQYVEWYSVSGHHDSLDFIQFKMKPKLAN